MEEGGLTLQIRPGLIPQAILEPRQTLAELRGRVEDARDMAHVLGEIVTNSRFAQENARLLGELVGREWGHRQTEDFERFLGGPTWQKGYDVGRVIGDFLVAIVTQIIIALVTAGIGTLAVAGSVAGRVFRTLLRNPRFRQILRRSPRLRRLLAAGGISSPVPRVTPARPSTPSRAGRPGTLAEHPGTRPVVEPGPAPRPAQSPIIEERAGRTARGSQTRVREIERWIDEAVQDAPVEGAEPLDPSRLGLSAPSRPRVHRLADVDDSDLSPARRAQFEARYPRYVQEREAEIAGGRTRRRPLSLEDYVRSRHGFDTRQLRPGESLVPRELGRAGAVEQEAGRVLQRVVDSRLPPGSSNTRSFPNRFGDPVIPDHLPRGNNTIFVDSAGRRAAQGTPFSARFVGDSNTRDFVPLTGQTRGFVNYARLSDTETLVFYVRWRETFPAEATLVSDAGLGGRVLPPRPWNARLLAPGLREMARRRGVRIRLVTDPAWR